MSDNKNENSSVGFYNMLKREKMCKESHLPEAPIGWPREIAPPLILTFSGFIPSSLTQAKDWAANASFSSNRSTSSIFHPAFDT